MAATRFQQHPGYPYGTGNWFDEQDNDLGFFSDRALAEQLLAMQEEQRQQQPQAQPPPVQPPPVQPPPVQPQVQVPRGLVPAGFQQSTSTSGSSTSGVTQSGTSSTSSSRSRAGALPEEMVQRHMEETQRDADEYQRKISELAGVTARNKARQAEQVAQRAQDEQTAAEAQEQQQNERLQRARQQALEWSTKETTNAWQEAGIGAQAVGLLGVFVGGFAGYMMGAQRNGPLDEINGIVARDTQRQLQDRDSAVAHWAREIGSAEAGVAAAEISKYKALDRQAKAMELRAQSEEEVKRAQAAQMQFKNEIKDRMRSLEREAYGKETIQEQQSQQEGTTTQQGTQQGWQESAGQSFARPPQTKPVGPPKHDVLPVGVEDHSPAVREALAAEYDPNNTTDRQQMKGYGQEMGQTEKIEQLENEIAVLLKVAPDANGKYPAENDEYSTAATGMYRPEWTMGERDRLLKNKVSQLEVLTREGWVTEPNGEVKQVELSGINRPTRDADWGHYLNQLRNHRLDREKSAGSSVVPRVRAAWKVQNQRPTGSGGGGIRPTPSNQRR